MTRIASEPICCLLLFYGGILSGIVSAAADLVRLRLKRSLFRHLTDVVLVLIGSAGLSFSLLVCNGGVLRLYLLLSFLAGILLSYASLFPIFTRKSQKNRKR